MTDRFAGDGRAVSEVLGYALVFSMILTAIAVVSLSGFASLENTRDAEQVNNAERAFDVLADNMADIYLHGAPSRATELSLGNAQLYTTDNVTMTVDYLATGESVTGEIRPLVYRAGDTTKLVYTGGTVFRDQRSGGLVLRDPPVVNDGGRVLVSVVQVQPNTTESVGSSNALVRAEERETTVALSDTTTTGTVAVTVTSTRPDLWERALENRGFGGCTNPVPDAVRCEQGSVSSVYVTVSTVRIELGR